MAKARTSRQRTTAGDGPDTAESVAGQVQEPLTTETGIEVTASENVEITADEPRSSAAAKPKIAEASPIKASREPFAETPARTPHPRSRRSRTILGEASFHNG